MQSFVSRVKTNPETGKHKGYAEELGKEKKKKQLTKTKTSQQKDMQPPDQTAFKNTSFFFFPCCNNKRKAAAACRWISDAVDSKAAGSWATAEEWGGQRACGAAQAPSAATRVKTSPFTLRWLSPVSTFGA